MRLVVGLSIICLSFTGVISAAEARVADDGAAADRTAVLKVVTSFFSAMRARDADAIRNLVQPKTQFVWIKPSGGGPRIVQESIEEFIPEAQAAPEPWLERIWTPTVHVDNGVAVVWARYDFHRGETFSHNGTDCYVLLKTAAGWKIVSLTFTVEPGARSLNPMGPPK
jgi:ketosteroid isomerase-like protein